MPSYLLKGGKPHLIDEGIATVQDIICQKTTPLRGACAQRTVRELVTA